MEVYRVTSLHIKLLTNHKMKKIKVLFNLIKQMIIIRGRSEQLEVIRTK